MKRSAVFLLVALSCAPVVRAQDASPATQIDAPQAATRTIVAPDPLAEDLENFGTLFQRGFFDELIYEINQKIEALPESEKAKPDPRLLHLRGASYYRLGWFEEALADMQAAQQDGRKVHPTQSWLKNIERKKQLSPPNLQEIGDNERTLFRSVCRRLTPSIASFLVRMSR